MNNKDLRVVHNKRGIKIMEEQLYKGLKNGYSKDWRSDGTLASESYYWKDILHGTRSEWDEYGNLIIQSEYLYGSCTSEKKLDENKNWLLKNFEIDEYEQIKDREDISELYKLTLEYRAYDSERSAEKIKDVIKKFERTAIVVNSDKEAITDNDTIFKRSLLGGINICKIGEDWPMHNYIPLSPLIQINVAELPFVPKFLEGLRYLVIFILNEEAIDYYGSNDTNLLVRTYTDEDISYLSTPAEINITPKIIAYERQLDFPTYDDTPAGIRENLKEYNSEFGEESSLQPIVDDKLLGWPFWCQSSELYSFKDAEFILQISDYDDDWLVGDCSTLYIFKCLKTNKYFSTIQMY